MSGPPPTGMPPISFDKVLGALTIGSWGDSMLLAIECMMVAQYFRKYPRDRWALKAMVLTVLAVDIISSIGNYAYVYLYTVSNWGNPAFLMRQQWPVIVFLPTTGMSACIVQMFLIARVWKLTQNWVIVPLLAIASLASCAGAWSTAIITFIHPLFQDRGMVEIPCMVWLIGSAVADTGIALSLIWQLSQARATQFEQTRGILSRLMTAAIQTGSAPAILALATLTAFLADKTSNICVGLGFCLGRVYALTLIYNLRLRGSHSRSTSRATSQSRSNGSSYTAKNTNDPHGIELGLGKMNVPRTTIVTIDETVTYDNYADPTHPKGTM